MMSERRVSYRWRHLTDLPADAAALVVPQLGLVAELWRRRLKDLRGSEVLREFNARLARRWSIETGVIEGVYRIERGITELLVEKGLEASLIPHGSTDKPGTDVVRILKDHESALEGLFSFVAGQRELSTSYIRELHQQLCANQATVVGLDAQGNRVEKLLRKGDWKLTPNNPHREDGSVHEYCPPEHVSSELDELVRLHKEHVTRNVAPEVEAAWLHHRFAQIHPFEDGNGRVARCLATLVLLRAELFPFIVEREEQGQYLDALEVADRENDLGPLVRMIARQQQGALLSALDLSRDVIREHEAAVSLERTLQEAARKLKDKEFKRQQEDFQRIEGLAKELVALARQRLAEVAGQLTERLGEVAGRYSIQAQESSDEESHWFRYQVVEVAKGLRYFANSPAWHRWARLNIRGENGGQVVFSFHQSGRDFRGVFMVTGFFELRSADETDEGKVFRPIVEEGFAITLAEDPNQARRRFMEWLDQAIAKGISEWMKMM
jgi:Fic family protein